MAKTRVIIVEDRDSDAALMALALSRQGFDLAWVRVDTASGLAGMLAQGPPDLVISDYRLPGFSAERALEMLRETGWDVPFILVSGKIGEDAVVAMMRAGAHDFVPKDCMGRLAPTVMRELREATNRQERRWAEQALRRSEEQLRLLTEHVQDIIFRCVLHPSFEMVYLSGAAATLTGGDRAALLGPPQRFLAHVADPQERQALEASWRAGSSRLLVVRWHRPDGAVLWLEQRAQGIHQHGRLMATEGVLRDVTERVLAEQENDLLIRQLEQAERLEALGQLAGGVAHDFNNALAVILTSADFVAEDLGAAHPCQPDVARIVHAAQLSSALTRQLLLFARRQPSTPHSMDLNTAVAGLKEMLRRTIGEDIELVCRPAGEPLMVIADRSKIEQVVINLVSNSRAAMPDGGRLEIDTALVEVSAAQPAKPDPAQDPQVPAGCYARLRVSDTGQGMSAEVARRAFDPFFTTKPAGEGTGLGLATAYGVVREAGGHITLHSELGCGTTVCVYLPRTQAAAPAVGTAAPGASSGAGETVLVVEDEAAVRDAVTRILTRHRYRVIAAASAAEAHDVFAGEDVVVDVVLTDVVMPGEAGTNLARRLRATRPGLPVVYMSGYAADHLPRDPCPGEGIPLIHKPFTAEELLAKLRQTLDAAPDAHQCAP